MSRLCSFFATANEIPLSLSPLVNRISVWVLSFTGFVLSALAVASCRYLKRVTVTLNGSLDASYHGLYNFQASYTCISSSLLSSLPTSEGTSSSLKAARGFGVLSALFGGGMLPA